MILIFHGSRDLQHNTQAIELAKSLGAGYAFMEIEPKFRGGLGIPMFVTDGSDYRKALEVATVKAPPLLKWPNFVNYLKSLAAELYIFHGPDTGDVRSLDIPVAFLYGEPNIEEVKCVTKAAPVVLTRGYIYKTIEAKYTSRCNAVLLPPLAEQEQFVQYLKATLPKVIGGAAGI